MVPEKFDLHMPKKRNLDPYFIVYIKINPKFIINLNVKPKAIKFLEEIRGEHLCYLWLDTDFFLDMTLNYEP